VLLPKKTAAKAEGAKPEKKGKKGGAKQSQSQEL
jgi:hypothetical protein